MSQRVAAPARVVVIGGSGHAKVVIDALQRTGRYAIVGVVARDEVEGGSLLGVPWLGSEDALPELVAEHDIRAFFVAIGENDTRARVTASAMSRCPDVALLTVIHPLAVVAPTARVAPGAAVMAGAVVGPDAEVGIGCIVNTCATLDHDSRMGDYSSLGPGAAVGGGVTIGERATIGIGASVIHAITIGAHTAVGAGAAVVGDLPSHVVAIGVPARPFRDRREGEPVY
jgi:sugar O-acyltransferase (sialic acid O-acetyltransferase NeuD family)